MTTNNTNEFKQETILKNSPNTKSFWNKKTIIGFVLGFAILVIVSVLVSIFFLGIDYSFIKELVNKPINGTEVGFMFGMIITLFYMWIWNGYYCIVTARQFGLKANFFEVFLFGVFSLFLNNITPFAFGSEAFKIYWLKKKGLTAREATLSVSSTTIFFSIAQIIVTWPSFIYFTTRYNDIISHDGVFAFWLTFVGLLVDLGVCMVLFSLSFSKRVHVFISSIFNRFLKWMKKPYKPKEEIINDFQTNSWFRTAYINEMKKISHVSILLIATMVYACMIYLSMFFSFRTLGYDQPIFSAINLFNLSNVAVTANNFVPIPGGEGTIQVLMKKFINVWVNTSSGVGLTQEQIGTAIDESIFVWRSFLFYIPTIVGLLLCPVGIYIHFKKKK